MSTLNLQLLTIPGNYKKGTLFHGPIAWVGLKSYAGIELPIGSGKKKGQFHTISPQCVVVTEIEYEIDGLIRELETIRKQAKSFFKREQAKETSQIEKRSK